MKIQRMCYLFTLLIGVNVCASAQQANTFSCSYLNLSNMPWTITIQLSKGMVDNNTSKTILLPASQAGTTSLPVTVSMTTYVGSTLPDSYYRNFGLSGTIYIKDSTNAEQVFELELRSGDSPYILHSVPNTGPVVLNEPYNCSILIPKNSNNWGKGNYTFPPHYYYGGGVD